MVKENYWSNYMYTKHDDTMTFLFVLSTILVSSAAASLQHLRMEFLNHISYVITEFAVTTQTLSHHYRSVTSSWTRGSLLCIYTIKTAWFVQNPTGTPGQFSKFLVVSKLLIYFCYFVCIILGILRSLLCISVFHVTSLSLDTFFDFHSKLVPLITLLSIVSVFPS